jgi:hypothetical protein
MKSAFIVVSIVAAAAISGCASPGSAEDFKWSVECPKSVDRGAEFSFVVKTENSAGQAVDGVKFRYQILWTSGSSQPLRHKGRSGDREKVHAHLVSGPATIVITSENHEGLEAKVLETGFEVK